ncbi:MAG: hypothetical protein HQL76_06950 [Magnetococcales bacterium]|nr:hypothetical protein [Magnetococcales bacterium]
MSESRDWFMLRPLEPVLFGQPRTRNAGDDHGFSSGFPPSPFAFQGAVRTHLLQSAVPALNLDDWSRHARDERERLIGGPDRLPAGWQLQGPLIANIQKSENGPVVAPWVPVPRFLLRDPERKRAPRPTKVIRLQETEGLTSAVHATQSLLFGRPDEDWSEPLSGWIGPDNLLWALAGKGTWHSKDHVHTPLPPGVQEEDHTGLALDPRTRTAEHGMLYTMKSLRFGGNAVLLGCLRGELAPRIPVDALHRGVVGLGFRRVLGAFEPAPRFHPSWETLLRGDHLETLAQQDEGYGWLLPLTPTDWTETDLRHPTDSPPATERPQEPDCTEKDPPRLARVFHAARSLGVTFCPQAWLCRRQVLVGGYRMAQGTTRPTRGMIPAGSVLHFTLKGANETARLEFLKTLHNANLAAAREEDAAFGFGHVLVGLGPEEWEPRK